MLVCWTFGPQYDLMDNPSLSAIAVDLGLMAGTHIALWLLSIMVDTAIFSSRLRFPVDYYSTTCDRWYLSQAIRKVFKDPVQCQGTWLHPFVLRMKGTRIGKRFFTMNPKPFVDAHFVSLGDDVTIDYDAKIRNHDFVNLTLSMDPITVGNGTCLRQGSLLAMSDTGEDCVLSPCAVTWKGLKLDDGSTYSGAPADVVC